MKMLFSFLALVILSFFHQAGASDFLSDLQEGDILCLEYAKGSNPLYEKSSFDHSAGEYRVSHCLYATSNQELICADPSTQKVTTYLVGTLKTMLDLNLITTLYTQRLKEEHKKYIPNTTKYIKDQIGKPFDFDFNFNSLGKHSCSDLIYRGLKSAGCPLWTVTHKYKGHPTTHPVDFLLQKDFFDSVPH